MQTKFKCKVFLKSKLKVKKKHKLVNKFEFIEEMVIGRS